MAQWLRIRLPMPSKAGDVGLIPGRGNNIPQAGGQLSLFFTTTEPRHPRTHMPQLRLDAAK